MLTKIPRALKVVNLKDQNKTMKNNLIKEIIYLKKLVDCDLVVKAFDYEIKNNADEIKEI